MTLGETEPDLPASVGGSPAEPGWGWGVAVAHRGEKDTGSRIPVKYSLA